MIGITPVIILYFTIPVNITGLLAMQNCLRYHLIVMANPMTLSPKTPIKNQKLLVLENIAKSLIANINEPTFPNLMVESIVNAFWSADAGIFFQWDATLKKLFLASYYRTDKQQSDDCLQHIQMEADEWIPGDLISTKMVKCYSRPEDLPETIKGLSPSSHQCLQQLFGKNKQWYPILGIPIYTDKQNIGVLLVRVQGSSIDFYEQEKLFMQLLADMVATAIQSARINQQDAIPHEVQVDQMRAEALAILSHEMRTPLASIKGYATALMLDEVNWSNEKRSEFLQLIDKETDNLKTMINEILDSSLIDIGQFMLEFQPVRLNLIARSVAEEMQQHSNIHQIVIDFPNDFPIVDADQHRITQVIRNIVDNAIKYSPDGGLILIRGEKRQKDVVISISDTGVGISPEDLIPLFDKYFRVKSPTGYYVPGTGLGLPVARALIEEHQGRIWAESQVGEGTILFFSLPFSQFDQE